jgi:hypothetical protein
VLRDACRHILQSDAPHLSIRGATGTSNMGAWILIAVMLAILAGAGYVAYQGWTVVEGEMPTSLHVAMWLGIIFSIVVGSGLMALLFYSHRKGFDARAAGEREPDERKRD